MLHCTWEDEESQRDLLAHAAMLRGGGTDGDGARGFDLILCSDCVYGTDTGGKLLKMLGALCDARESIGGGGTAGNDNRESGSNKLTIILAFGCRGRGTSEHKPFLRLGPFYPSNTTS